MTRWAFKSWGDRILLRFRFYPTLQNDPTLGVSDGKLQRPWWGQGMRSRGSVCGVCSLCFLSGWNWMGRGQTATAETCCKHPSWTRGLDSSNAPAPFSAMEIESAWQSILNAKKPSSQWTQLAEIMFYAFSLINKQRSSYLAILILFLIGLLSIWVMNQISRKGVMEQSFLPIPPLRTQLTPLPPFLSLWCYD